MGHDHDHAVPPDDRDRRRLTATLLLVLGYMIAEVVGGLASGSLALLADAGHMLSDAGALVVSLFALRIASRPPSATHTFGYRRAEVLAALANGAALVAIAGTILYEAVQRLGEPTEVRGPLMLGIAAGGLVVNLLGLWILRGGRSDNLNVRGAWLHVVADALGSVGAIAAGLLVTLLGWTWADPLASIAIALLVVYSAWHLLEQAVGVLMQSVPDRIDLPALERSLASVDGVVGVHDLHVWSVASHRDVMSAHLTVAADCDRHEIMEEVLRRLRDDFDVHHSTLQLDCPDECAPCEASPARRC